MDKAIKTEMPVASLYRGDGGSSWSTRYRTAGAWNVVVDVGILIKGGWWKQLSTRHRTAGEWNVVVDARIHSRAR